LAQFSVERRQSPFNELGRAYAEFPFEFTPELISLDRNPTVKGNYRFSRFTH
jgi:hypothetical protein